MRIAVGPRAVPILSVLLAGIVLAWPAYWNGYPLLFTDSASYIGVLNPWGQHWARPIFYSLALWPLHLGISLWPVVVAQGVLMAHLLWLVLRVVGGTVKPGVFALAVLLLAVGSSLPWYAAQVMPDLLTPAVVLCAFLLGFGGSRVGRWERAWLALLLAGAAACHLSHLPLAVGLLLGVAVLRWLARGPGGHGAALLPMAGAILLAASAHLAVNWAVRGAPVLSPASPLFLLARSVADGPAAAYLREVCPQAGFRLCAEVDRLPADADLFLWDRDGPLWRAARLKEEPERQTAAGMDFQPEAQAILDGALARHGGWQLAAAARNVLLQFHRADTADGLDPYGEGQAVSRAIRDEFPGEYAAYLGSRQSRGTLGRDAVNALHRPVLLAAAVLAVALAAFHAQARYRALVAVVALGLLGNGIVAGALSGPHHRYQSRVACLIVLAAGVGLALPAQRRTRPGLARAPMDRGARVAI
ncbi:MAG TPA: hypothetical protein VEB20_18470 [Azospirillaceae bacterium]|nr:hypothetical protein [Azospirillaceae bacterium]